ncbi:MAG: alkaline phosphatase family protein, partial [Candidatus Tumulicola sp.]
MSIKLRLPIPRVFIFLAALPISISGCAQSSGSPGGASSRIVPAIRSPGSAAASDPIKHIVIIIQENRSFDNIFAGYPGANAPTSGYMHDGTLVPLHSVNFKGLDIAHGWSPSLVDYDSGKMDGFDLSNPYAPKYPYSYVDRKDVKPYWTMAQKYALADNMFPTEMGASFTAHMDLVAGTSFLNSTLALADVPSNVPWGCDAPASTTTPTVDNKHNYKPHGPYPCFTQFTTIADTLDAAGVTWKYYAPAIAKDWGGKTFSIFDAISNIRNGPDWQNDVISPQWTILNDAATTGGLPAVSWVVPDFADSDHPGTNSDTGPSWVAAIVNAVGQGPSWDSTVVIVLWDDWGGWYDNVPPPQLDFVGLAIRVPCIIISPYTKARYVSHTQYEYGTILKF